MSTTSGNATTERQRERESRKLRRNGTGRPVDPPRQRRPALAAIAVLLIVGGALLAGLLAIRMDSREAVLVARTDIAPGTQITEEDLAEAQVASDVLQTIPVSAAEQVIGTYATTEIPADSLVEERSLSNEAPVNGERAIVGITLNPVLTPASELSAGDLVNVVRVTGGGGAGGEVQEITTALVLSISASNPDDLAASAAPTASLLVPSETAGAVIDASSADLAGLALLQRGQGTDVELAPAEETTP